MHLWGVCNKIMAGGFNFVTGHPKSPFPLCEKMKSATPNSLSMIAFSCLNFRVPSTTSNNKTRRPMKLNQENQCRVRAQARPPAPRTRSRTEQQRWNNKEKQPKPAQEQQEQATVQQGDQGSLTNESGAVPMPLPASPARPTHTLQTQENNRSLKRKQTTNNNTRRQRNMN